MDAMELQSPLDGTENDLAELDPRFKWIAKWANNVKGARPASAGAAHDAEDDVVLTFGQKMKKHFFEDMRLMYVSTTGALLKALRCTPVVGRGRLTLSNTS
jgi:hypothetical protein